MQICLLKQIKQTITAKNTTAVWQDYPLKQSDSYCEKYDCFYEDYLLKQIKETITAKNTTAVVRIICCDKWKCVFRNWRRTQHGKHQRRVPFPKVNWQQTIGKTSTFQTIRKATETRQTTKNCLPPLPVVLQQKYCRCFYVMQTACRKRRQNFRKRYCKQNCTW